MSGILHSRFITEIPSRRTTAPWGLPPTSNRSESVIEEGRKWATKYFSCSQHFEGAVCSEDQRKKVHNQLSIATKLFPRFRRTTRGGKQAVKTKKKGAKTLQSSPIFPKHRIRSFQTSVFKLRTSPLRWGLLQDRSQDPPPFHLHFWLTNAGVFFSSVVALRLLLSQRLQEPDLTTKAARCRSALECPRDFWNGRYQEAKKEEKKRDPKRNKLERAPRLERGNILRTTIR